MLSSLYQHLAVRRSRWHRPSTLKLQGKAVSPELAQYTARVWGSLVRLLGNLCSGRKPLCHGCLELATHSLVSLPRKSHAMHRASQQLASLAHLLASPVYTQTPPSLPAALHSAFKVSCCVHVGLLLASEELAQFISQAFNSQPSTGLWSTWITNQGHKVFLEHN